MICWKLIIWNSYFPTGKFDFGDLCPISGARNGLKIYAPFTHHGLDPAVADVAVLDLLRNTVFENFVDIADLIWIETSPTDRARCLAALDPLIDAHVAERMRAWKNDCLFDWVSFQTNWAIVVCVVRFVVFVQLRSHFRRLRHGYFLTCFISFLNLWNNIYIYQLLCCIESFDF